MNYQDLDNESLGMVVKEQIAMLEESSEKLERMMAFSAALWLCCYAASTNAETASFDFSKVTTANVPIGNWKVTVINKE